MDLETIKKMAAEAEAADTSGDESGSDEGEMQADPVVETPAKPAEGEKPAAEGVKTEEEPEKPAEEPAKPAEGEKPAAEASTYTPNLKYKFAVEGKSTAEEREFDERFKSIIKSEDDEKLIRELHEKAYGLDFIKPRFNQAREELKQVKQLVQERYQPVIANVQKLDKALANDDFDSAMELLEVPFEKLMTYVADKLKYQELSPAEQRQVDAYRNERRKSLDTSESYQQLAAQNDATAVQLRTMELNLALDRSEVKSVAEAVDAVRGPGTFRNEVIRLGKAAYLEKRIDRPVDELVQEAASNWRPFLQANPPASDPAKALPGGASTTAPAAPGKPAAATRAKPAVLPNVEAQATVPTRKEITSLDDLKKLRKEMNTTQLAE